MYKDRDPDRGEDDCKGSGKGSGKGEAQAQLQSLWLQGCERLLATLQLHNARHLDAVAAELQQLHTLRDFLATPVRPRSARAPMQDSWLAETAAPAPLGDVAQLSSLLLTQASLQGTTPAATAAACRQRLRQQLGQELLQIATACRKSAWTLAWCVSSGLAQRCHQAALLGRFCDDATLAQQLEQLALRILVCHAAGHRPGTMASSSLQASLLSLANSLQQPGPAGLAAQGLVPGQAFSSAPALTAQDTPPTPDALALSELRQWRQQLLDALRPAAPPTEALMLASYRLLWVLQASGQQQAADCGLLVYQILARHWQLLQALPAPVATLLECWLDLIPGTATNSRPAPATAGLLSCIAAALQCWPQRRSEQALIPGQQAPGAQQGQALHAGQMPEIMAAALHTLLQVEADWFIDRTAWQHSQRLLLPELYLLEQGAAALRLGTLETLASQLLSLHELLLLDSEDAPWPGATLWQVHEELVCLLDRTALWQEARLSDNSRSALQAAVQQAELRLQALASPTLGCKPEASTEALARSLALFLRQLAQVLGKELHLSLDLAAMSPALQPPAMLPVLQELLRWVLLRQEHGSEWRRNLRLPMASSLSLRLQPASEAASGGNAAAASVPSLVAVALIEPEARSVLDARSLRHLQRKLGPTARELRCELLPGGAGRCLHLLLAPP